MNRAIFAAATLLLPLASFAATWSAPVTITGYYIWDEGAAHIKTSNNLNPNNECTSGQYLTLDTARTNFKAIWAQIIAAHTSGQTVSLFYDGCIGPHPRIRAISIPDVW